MWSLTKKGGGTESTICLDELAALVGRLGDANANEITAEYNRGRCKAERRHVSSIKRALHRAGFVVKKSASGRWNSSDPMLSKSESSSEKKSNR